MKIKKKYMLFFFLGEWGGGGWVGGGVWLGGLVEGGQAGCERIIEVFVKIQKI